MAEEFLVVGAGGHAKVVIDALLASGHRILACYDDDLALTGKVLLPGVSVVGPLSLMLTAWKKGLFVVVAIGDNSVRCTVALRYTVDYGLAVAPSAVLGKGVVLGHGSMVLPSATLNADANVGRHVIVNTASSIDHDCRVGDFVHIAPGCTLGGNVTVGEGTFLGIGVRAIPGVRIGRWSVIGAGTVVTKDLPDNCTAVGVPARVIKTRQEGWQLS